MWIYKILFIGLFLTLVIELAFAVVWKVSHDDIKLVVLVNIVTNPLVVLLYYILLQNGVSGMGCVLVLEFSAIAFEGIVYKLKTNISKPIIFAVLANAISYGMGLLLF